MNMSKHNIEVPIVFVFLFTILLFVHGYVAVTYYNSEEPFAGRIDILDMYFFVGGAGANIVGWVWWVVSLIRLISTYRKWYMLIPVVLIMCIGSSMVLEISYEYINDLIVFHR